MIRTQNCTQQAVIPLEIVLCVVCVLGVDRVGGGDFVFCLESVWILRPLGKRRSGRAVQDSLGLGAVGAKGGCVLQVRESSKRVISFCTFGCGRFLPYLLGRGYLLLLLSSPSFLSACTGTISPGALIHGSALREAGSAFSESIWAPVVIVRLIKLQNEIHTNSSVVRVSKLC